MYLSFLMKRSTILLLCMTMVMYTAAGYYDSGVTKKASTEQVSVCKGDNSIVKAISFEYEVPSVMVYVLPTLRTPKPQLIPYAEKLAEGYFALNKSPPDYRCQKS